jgi:hypothetical protein
MNSPFLFVFPRQRLARNRNGLRSMPVKLSDLFGKLLKLSNRPWRKLSDQIPPSRFAKVDPIMARIAHNPDVVHAVFPWLPASKIPQVMHLRIASRFGKVSAIKALRSVVQKHLLPKPEPPWISKFFAVGFHASKKVRPVAQARITQPIGSARLRNGAHLMVRFHSGDRGLVANRRRVECRFFRSVRKIIFCLRIRNLAGSRHGS